MSPLKDGRARDSLIVENSQLETIKLKEGSTVVNTGVAAQMAYNNIVGNGTEIDQAQIQ